MTGGTSGKYRARKVKEVSGGGGAGWRWHRWAAAAAGVNCAGITGAGASRAARKLSLLSHPLVAPPLLFSPGRRGSRAGSQRAGQSEQVAVSVEVGPSTSWFELPSPSLPLAWHR